MPTAEPTVVCCCLAVNCWQCDRLAGRVVWPSDAESSRWNSKSRTNQHQKMIYFPHVFTFQFYFISFSQSSLHLFCSSPSFNHVNACMNCDSWLQRLWIEAWEKWYAFWCLLRLLSITFSQSDPQFPASFFIFYLMVFSVLSILRPFQVKGAKSVCHCFYYILFPININLTTYQRKTIWYST